VSGRGGTENTLAENILQLIDKRLAETHVSMPAKINSYDSSKQRAEIEILVKQSARYGDKVLEEAVIIPDVPVIFPAASGTSFITFPVASGTLGEVRFSDVAIDSWIESDGKAALSTKLERHHDFSDCYFTPGLRPYSQKLDGFSDSAVVIRNNGSTVEVGDGKFKVENSVGELIAILSAAFDQLSKTLVYDAVTQTYILPFDPATIAAMTLAKTKLDSFV
jgi:hypothetical protein